MRSVVKHSYIKGVDRVARASAHINYIQYREGEDREKGGGRPFFDNNRDDLLGRDVKADLAKNGGRFVHKLILSPGVENVDIHAYSRAVLKQISRDKGVDLDWRAVEHGNTDHPHAHVVVFGKDKLGKEVQLKRSDYDAMREYGDRYIVRHHEFDRFADREVQRMLLAPNYAPEGDARYKGLLEDLKRAPGEEKAPVKERYKAKEWDVEAAIKNLPEAEKIKGKDQTYTRYSKLDDLRDFAERLKTGEESSNEFQKLRSWIDVKEWSGDDFYELKAKSKWDKKEKKREERLSLEDDREHRKLDKDLKKAMQDPDRASSENFGKGYKERLRETQGRLGTDHGHYAAQEEMQRLKEQSESDPSRKEEFDQKIEELKKWDQEQRSEGSRWKDLDGMLGERYGWEQKELAQIVKAREIPLPIRAEPEQAKNGSEAAKEPGKELDQEKEQENQPETKANGNRWQELDSMLGERFGQQDERAQGKELERQQSQQQMRQFQDQHNSEIQKPVLEREELDRDDGEDLFARGER